MIWMEEPITDGRFLIDGHSDALYAIYPEGTDASFRGVVRLLRGSPLLELGDTLVAVCGANGDPIRPATYEVISMEDISGGNLGDVLPRLGPYGRLLLWSKLSRWQRLQVLDGFPPRLHSHQVIAGNALVSSWVSPRGTPYNWRKGFKYESLEELQCRITEIMDGPDRAGLKANPQPAFHFLRGDHQENQKRRNRVLTVDPGLKPGGLRARLLKNRIC